MRNASKAVVLALVPIALCASIGWSQSGRKLEIKKASPPESTPDNSNSAAAAPQPQVSQPDYRCLDDDGFERIVHLQDENEAFASRAVDVKAFIETKPKAGYTREARQAGVQGFVVLRIVLLSSGKLGPIRVVRGLPAGLTESALRAACKMKFRPAIKDGKEVSQFVQVEYLFRVR